MKKLNSKNRNSKYNKNRIIISLLFLFTLYSLNSEGQGFYINAGGGYGLKTLSQQVDANYSGTIIKYQMQSGTASTIKEEAIVDSYGRGFAFGLAFGYMFSEKIGGEIGFSYLSGSSINSFSNYNITSDYGGGFGYKYTVNESFKRSASMIRIIPALKLQATGGSVIPYMKLGLVIGISPSISVDIESSLTNSNSSVSDSVFNRTIKYSQGSTMGFMAAIGIDIIVSNKVSLFWEVNIIGQTYAPLHGEMTSSITNGKDVLSQMSISQKQIDFVDSNIQSNSGGFPTNPSVPEQALKTYLPFSSFGLNFGLHFSLN